MANFNFESYQAAVSAAQNKGTKKESSKIGYFRLADGDECLVRFMVSSLADLDFATIHRVKRTPEDKYASMEVSCLNDFGSKSDDCPLCKAFASGNQSVGKVSKRVYIKALVAYKDSTTGTFTTATPVIIERAAGFSKDLATAIRDYGDLRKVLFKMSRSGAGLDTTYSFNYAVPTVYKPELVPEDFSAFDNFDISRHSYWVKTAEECEAYVATGSFPEVTTKKEESVIDVLPTPAPVVDDTIVAPVPGDADIPVEVKSEEKKQPVKFNGFSF